MLAIKPITLKQANAYVSELHRHNIPTTGHKWSVGCYEGDRLCGVAIAGQPIARHLDDGETIEVRRVCTDGTRNACSFLYGACARIAKEFGYKRIITYTLESEPGTSLKASGWTDCGLCGGGQLEFSVKAKGSGANYIIRHICEVFDRTEAQMGKAV